MPAIPLSLTTFKSISVHNYKYLKITNKVLILNSHHDLPLIERSLP